MNLFNEIESLVVTLGGWTSVPKAQTYAALILGLRPDVSVEIGVWYGRGSLSMALAHKEIGKGVVYAIDAWSPEASAEGQDNDADRKHWAGADHNVAYNTFISYVDKLGVGNCVRVFRERSQRVTPPENIGLLVIDGNHGPEAIKDVALYAPKVRSGGVVYVDDLSWTGNYVQRAYSDLVKLGFQELYRFETGCFMQRV